MAGSRAVAGAQGASSTVAAWRERRPRSPPGTWRLFGPALLAWVAGALAILAPGRGGVLALTAGVVGFAVLTVSALRCDLRWVARHLLIACAVLVLLGASVEAGHRARGDAAFARAAESGGETAFTVMQRGFVETRSSLSGKRAWVQGEAKTPSGGIPVVLWFDGVPCDIDGSADIGAGTGGAGTDAGAGTSAGAGAAGSGTSTSTSTGTGTGAGTGTDAGTGARAVTGGGGGPSPSPGAAADEDGSTGQGGGRGASESGAGGCPAGEEARWGPGTVLSVTGELVPLESGSSAAYGVRVADARAVEPSGFAARAEAGLGSGAVRLRALLRDAAAEVPGAALVPGFAVGDTALVDEDLEARMMESSLLHLIAVSGANCAILIGAANRGAALLGIGRRLRSPVAAAALLGFVFVVGPDASVQRAAVMAAVLLVSDFGGKRAASLPALGAAMIVLLLRDPWQALHPGFALSVAATAGILLLVPSLERAARRSPVPLPRWLVLPVAVALAAQLACGPLLLLLQPGIPAAGVLANVLAAPAAPLGTGLGLLALVALPALPPLGEALVVLASLPGRWVEATASVVSQLPAARLAWPEGWPGAALLAAVETGMLAAWGIASRRIALTRLDREGQRRPWQVQNRLSRPAAVLVAALSAGALGLFAGPTLIAPIADAARTPDDWRMVACDVGQGDALLLRDPAAPDEVMLVDTGDDPEKLTACLDRFGVHRIALLVLTHDDRDHVGALSAVAARTEHVLVAPDNAEDGPDRPLLDRLRRAGLPYAPGGAGATGGTTGLTWEVLAPAPGVVPADTNAASLVLRVESGGLSVLLLADTGADEQTALRRSGAELRSDVVKIAHHGSRDQDPSLPRDAVAELAVVSVGENGYGHPTAEAIAAFESAGTPVVRTDRHGSIAIAGEPGDPGGLSVWFERNDVGGSQ